MYAVPIVLFLLILAVTPSVASSSAKLFIVQQISLVQCLDGNQTCVVVADGITERELEVITPDIDNSSINEQNPYGHSGNPFIGEHTYRINS